MPRLQKTVNVHYNPNQTSITCTPATVFIDKVDESVVFQRQSGETWSFVGIKNASDSQPLPSPPFGTPTVSVDFISVEDDNSRGTGQTFNYCIGIRTESGDEVWSDPQIINRSA